MTPLSTCVYTYYIIIIINRCTMQFAIGTCKINMAIFIAYHWDVLVNDEFYYDNCLTLDDEDTCIEISFPDLTTFPTFEKLDGIQIDSFSDPIYIPGGLVFGDKIVTTLYVRIPNHYNELMHLYLLC